MKIRAKSIFYTLALCLGFNVTTMIQAMELIDTLSPAARQVGKQETFTPRQEAQPKTLQQHLYEKEFDHVNILNKMVREKSQQPILSDRFNRETGTSIEKTGFKETLKKLISSDRSDAEKALAAKLKNYDQPDHRLNLDDKDLITKMQKCDTAQKTTVLNNVIKEMIQKERNNYLNTTNETIRATILKEFQSNIRRLGYQVAESDMLNPDQRLWITPNSKDPFDVTFKVITKAQYDQAIKEDNAKQATADLKQAKSDLNEKIKDLERMKEHLTQDLSKSLKANPTESVVQIQNRIKFIESEIENLKTTQNNKTATANDINSAVSRQLTERTIQQQSLPKSLSTSFVFKPSFFQGLTPEESSISQSITQESSQQTTSPIAESLGQNVTTIPTSEEPKYIYPKETDTKGNGNESSTEGSSPQSTTSPEDKEFNELLQRFSNK